MFPFDDVITINTIDSPHIAAEYNTTMDTIGRKEAKTLLRLQWCHNEHDGVSNHQPHDYLLNRLFRRRSKNIKAPCHWPLCGEFTDENVSIWWRHHAEYEPYQRAMGYRLIWRKDTASYREYTVFRYHAVHLGSVTTGFGRNQVRRSFWGLRHVLELTLTWQCLRWRNEYSDIDGQVDLSTKWQGCWDRPRLPAWWAL